MCSGVLFTVLFFPFAFLPPPEDALFPHHSYRHAMCLGSWPRRKSKREKGPRQRRPGESLPREDLWEDLCSSQRLVDFTYTGSSAQDLWSQLSSIYSPPCQSEWHLQPPPPPFLFSGHIILYPHVLHTQFMQKKEEGDDVHRSAVTGKVIKMKVRKSSKDKEVCVLWIQVIPLRLTCSSFYDPKNIIII